MHSIDANGQRLTPLLVIEAHKAARKLAPARFLSLRLHPDRFRELESFTVQPEVIQLSETPWQLGKTITRLACVKPPLATADGIGIKQDEKADPTKLVFEIHGVAELEVVNLGDC